MRRTFERAIARTVRRGRARAVVLDAAILLEAGWDTLCDRVVFVEAPRDRRLARLAADARLDRGDARRPRGGAVAARPEASPADVVVVNDDDSGPESLREEVRRLAAAILPRPAPRPSGVGSAGPVLGRPTDTSRRP